MATVEGNGLLPEPCLMCGSTEQLPLDVECRTLMVYMAILTRRAHRRSQTRPATWSSRSAEFPGRGAVSMSSCALGVIAIFKARRK